MTRSLRAALAVAVCVLFAPALRAQGPSALPTADAATFMGTWLLTLESPQGPFALTMALTDVEGKVACELTSKQCLPRFPTPMYDFSGRSSR